MGATGEKCTPKTERQTRVCLGRASEARSYRLRFGSCGNTRLSTILPLRPLDVSPYLQSFLHSKGRNSTHQGTELELRLSRTEVGSLVPRTLQRQRQGPQGSPLGCPTPIPSMPLIPGADKQLRGEPVQTVGEQVQLPGRCGDGTLSQVLGKINKVLGSEAQNHRV